MISLVNTDILEEVELQLVYRIIWVILKSWYLNPRKWHMESVFIEISKDQLQVNKNILIGVIYRPPATDVRCFNIKLNVYLVKIRKENQILR